MLNVLRNKIVLRVYGEREFRGKRLFGLIWISKRRKVVGEYFWFIVDKFKCLRLVFFCFYYGIEVRK